MLRASVSVVGRSILSLVDIMLKMQLLLLFYQQLRSSAFFTFLKNFYNHLEGDYI